MRAVFANTFSVILRMSSRGGLYWYIFRFSARLSSRCGTEVKIIFLSSAGRRALQLLVSELSKYKLRSGAVRGLTSSWWERPIGKYVFLVGYKLGDNITNTLTNRWPSLNVIFFQLCRGIFSIVRVSLYVNANVVSVDAMCVTWLVAVVMVNILLSDWSVHDYSFAPCSMFTLSSCTPACFDFLKN